MRTPKIARFNALIKWINQFTGSALAINSVDNSNILNNAWLSGFIEADGSFDIRVSLLQTGALENLVSARLRLEQRMIDQNTGVSYLNVMTSIAKALGVTLKTSIHNAGLKYYIVSASSVKSRLVIVKYFTLFPLFSSKRLNYLDWLACNDLIVNKEHTSEEGRKKAILLKAGMNSKRSFFNWDHLKDLKSY